jgi:hypothetical protein
MRLDILLVLNDFCEPLINYFKLFSTNCCFNEIGKRLKFMLLFSRSQGYRWIMYYLCQWHLGSMHYPCYWHQRIMHYQCPWYWWSMHFLCNDTNEACNRYSRHRQGIFFWVITGLWGKTFALSFTLIMHAALVSSKLICTLNCPGTVGFAGINDTGKALEFIKY